VDAEHWPDDMPEKLLATLGATPAATNAG